MKTHTHIDDALLVKFLQGETSPEEDAAVQLWLGASSENARHFEAVEALWHLRLQNLVPRPTDVDAAWQTFRQRMQHSKPRSKRIPSWLLAAACIAAIAVGFILFYNREPSVPQMVTFRAEEKVRIDTLPDGSIATLNKQTALVYPKKFKGAKRPVQLKGEAFFSVKPDKAKPFVIQAGTVQITVLGTSFNVRNTDSLTEVIVETGRVEVKSGSDVYVLNPGDKLTVGPQLARKEKQSDKLYSYYRSEEFVCDNTPLWKLIAALNRAYDANIVIDRPALKEMHLTATFSGESLDRILEIIALTLDVKVVRSGDNIHLR